MITDEDVSEWKFPSRNVGWITKTHILFSFSRIAHNKAYINLAVKIPNGSMIKNTSNLKQKIVITRFVTYIPCSIIKERVMRLLSLHYIPVCAFSPFPDNERKTSRSQLHTYPSTALYKSVQWERTVFVYIISLF